jgi:fibrillarin-like rRNA methylase
MKSFQQFISESINIAGDFNGNLYMNSSQPEITKESFLADIVWEGKIYRLEVEGKMMNKNELAEQLQNEYPGAIVHNVYPMTENSIKVKNAQRYRPERLSWSE